MPPAATWPKGGAIGKHVWFNPARKFTIVGVVGTVKRYGLDIDGRIVVYLPSPNAGILTRVMASLLFGVGATDALTFSIVPVVLIATAMVAAIARPRCGERTIGSDLYDRATQLAARRRGRRRTRAALARRMRR